ncbi:hypothetical protein BDR22DRAFT_887575 [Usnea florida]
MEDNESQSLIGLNEKMNAVHLQVSQPSSGEQSSRDTRDESTVNERPTLSNLAGELQNLIFKHLHPPAAVRLRQTNHYFSSIVDIPISAVFDYLQEKEQLPTHSDDFACFTCLRLKSRSSFGKSQTRSPRGKDGDNSRERFCVDCGIKARKYNRSCIIVISENKLLLCRRCETLQKRFCEACRLCDSCIGKGYSICQNHNWIGPRPAGTTSSWSTHQSRETDWYFGVSD